MLKKNAPSARRAVMLLTVVLTAGVLAGCGDGADGGQDAGAPSPTGETPVNGDATEDGQDGDGNGATGPTVELELVAEGNRFNQEQLEVPSGAQVVLALQNNDSVPHNFAVYESEDAENDIFVGETFSGPDASQTYEFSAPSEPDTYFFRCDVHPTTMTGDFIVD